MFNKEKSIEKRLKKCEKDIELIMEVFEKLVPALTEISDGQNNMTILIQNLLYAIQNFQKTLNIYFPPLNLNNKKKELN